ncbi:hypothetical protein CPAV1605_1303 [seawater metagenome]|uniref:Uncharacterized protein n=1 Tax=seawater metagenome TaxID=1561972 RepID=A0A5E8CJT3_9ZZZZ
MLKYFIGLILIINLFKNSKPINDKMCCKALTASCIACSQNKTIKEVCKNNKGLLGC